MAKFFPVFLSLILNLYGIYIFVTPTPPPKDVSCPLMSSIFFILAVFILILDMRLYATSFRRLHWLLNNVYQFIVSSFMIERLVDDLWFPLEIKAMTLLPLIGDLLDYIGKYFGIVSTTQKISMILHRKDVEIMSSYALSLLVLSSVLYATRIVDFRILFSCGFSLFVADVQNNLRLIRRRIFRKFGRFGSKSTTRSS